MWEQTERPTIDQNQPLLLFHREKKRVVHRIPVTNCATMGLFDDDNFF